MRVRYGNYRLPHGATEVSITADPVLGAKGIPVEHVVSWLLKTRLKNPGSDPLAFGVQLHDMMDAFSVHGRDLVIETEAGVSSFHQLLSSNCLGGTRVVKAPQFPTGRKGQLVTHRDVEIVVQGRVPVMFGWTNYLSFQETISISGGGARWGCREVNFGPGVRQLLRTNTICRASQSGSAVGHLSYPTIPAAIWPDALVDQYPEVSDTSPRVVGRGLESSYTEFQRSWSYTYELPTRLSGSPHFLT